jgi:hypothetical protein
MPDTTSLKNAIKWTLCDKFVIVFAAVGIILLLITLIFFAEDINSIKYRGMAYITGETGCSCLLLKMATPALSVSTLQKMMYARTIPQYILLYTLMFVAQIVVYGIIGKIASIMSSGRAVAVFIFIGIVLLALALSYEINPAQESLIDSVRGKPFYLFLVVSNLPALFTEQYLLGALSNTALIFLILFPSMFVVQIILYGFLGKLLVNIIPRL